MNVGFLRNLDVCANFLAALPLGNSLAVIIVLTAPEAILAPAFSPNDYLPIGSVVAFWQRYLDTHHNFPCLARPRRCEKIVIFYK